MDKEIINKTIHSNEISYGINMKAIEENSSEDIYNTIKQITDDVFNLPIWINDYKNANITAMKYIKEKWEYLDKKAIELIIRYVSYNWK